MGDIIPFPQPKIEMTEEETKEYHEIKKEILEAKTLRDIWYVRKKAKAFLKKMEEQANKKR